MAKIVTMWSKLTTLLLIGLPNLASSNNIWNHCRCSSVNGTTTVFSCGENHKGFTIHVTKFGEIRIDCSKGTQQLDIDQLPSITFSKFETFSINSCQLFQGSGKNFDHAGLQELQLQKNRIKLKKNIFLHLSGLKTLNLSQNQIDRLPEGTFQGLDRLEVLVLRENNLTNLDRHIFEGLTGLKCLKLDSNLMETLSGDALQNLPNLLHLHLSKNGFKTLSSNFMGRNTMLQGVLLEDDRLEYLPDYFFSNLSHLQNVSLKNNKLETFPENAFQGSDNIKSVILKGNHLKHLPGELFKGLRNMVNLDVSNNKLEGLGDEFAPLIKLKVLVLDNNLISEVGAEVFKNLANLEEISLHRNRIRSINSNAFDHCENLKRIDLSYNYYSGEHEYFPLLANVNNAETINLAHNEITDLDDVIYIDNKLSLTLLDLSFNRITSIHIKNLRPISDKFVVNLEHNNITNVSFKDVNRITQETQSVINLAHNPLECDCNNYDLSRYIRNEMAPEVKLMFDIQTDNIVCSSPAALQGQEFEKLQPQLLVCPVNDTCPEDCDCCWRPYDSAIVVDCSSRNLSEFPALDWSQVRYFYNQTEMHLEGNELVEGPQKNQSGYDNVTKLHLSSNKIEALTWLPPKLEVLRLDHNNLRNVSYQILTQLNGSLLYNLTLNGNPWVCDCNAVNFTNFLRQHTKMVDTGNILCHNRNILLRDRYPNNLCYEWQHANTVLIVLLPPLPVLIFFAIFSCYKQEIKVWLFAHGWLSFWVTETELDKNKQYDAFISYSHKDEDFVVQDLLPILNNTYTLCLHYRNWVPGEFITAQVTKSVLQSRRTLIVLSKNFLESVWGKMEFRTAHTQAMTDGLARVVIVLYGDVETESLDDELKTYMKTNTYVKWGDPSFWSKLRYALPHSKLATTSDDNRENHMI